MMAYDSTNDVAVMFGGWNGPYLNDTWIYSFQDNTWINKSPPESPSPRERGGLVYASKHNEVILYGGYNGAKMLSETWVYSVDENRWTQLFPYVSPPSALNMVNLGMVYDSKDDVVIMFSDEGNTWVYDITANTWRNMQPSVSPSPRALSTNGEQMVYDASTDSVLLFGGSSTWNYWLDTEDSVALGDTWAYNYNANTWTNLQPTPAPDDRLNAQMVFDSVNNIVVLYGGAPSGQNSLFNDTWIYRGASNSWEKATSRDSPPVRYASAMAFSPLHNQAILFGGYNNLQGKFFSDTWAFTYSSNPAPTPTPMQSNSDLFSVDSNSTVTDLAFNSASRELSFKVTGPSETTGYVHTIIAKSLLPDVSSLKVYLDGNQLNYTATNQQDSWDIYFTYNHSTHSVEMHLGNPFTNYVLAAIIVIFIITIVSILLSVKRRNKDK